MGSPSFGLPTSGNNAPLPIPGNTNPTGTNQGVGFGGVSFPNYPMFGALGTSPVSPSANAPLFGGGMTGLSSGFSGLGDSSFSGKFYNQLGKAYGQGSGQLLGNIIENGLFNPQVAAAFLNAMQPGVARGQESIMNAFGAEGSRFGSAAALGLGDYQSQVNLNEQQILASMFQNAQQEQLQLLEGVLPTLHAERANSGGWIHDLLGGLEIAGGIIGAPFTGGMSLGLVGAGAQQLGQGLSPGSSPTSGGGFGLPGMTQMPGLGVGNTGTFGSNAPSVDSWVNDWMANEQVTSAASALGGAAPSSLSPDSFGLTP